MKKSVLFSEKIVVIQWDILSVFRNLCEVFLKIENAEFNGKQKKDPLLV